MTDCVSFLKLQNIIFNELRIEGLGTAFFADINNINFAVQCKDTFGTLFTERDIVHRTETLGNIALGTTTFHS